MLHPLLAKRLALSQAYYPCICPNILLETYGLELD